jgi:hypothetical protein
VKVTIELNECDIEELLEVLSNYPDLITKLSEQYRVRYSNPATKDTD